MLNGNQLVNLTPHTITCIEGVGMGVYPPSGKTVRVEEFTTPVSEGLKQLKMGGLIGLPTPTEGITFIVSRLVLLTPEAQLRADLVAPDQLVRGEGGTITGSKGWLTTPAYKG